MSLLADEKRDYLQALIARVNSSTKKIDIHDLSNIALEAIVLKKKMEVILKSSEISPEEKEKAIQMIKYARSLEERIYNLYNYSLAQQTRSYHRSLDKWRTLPW